MLTGAMMLVGQAAGSGSPMSIAELSTGQIFWIGAGVVAVVSILVTGITSTMNTRARERSRREIAAYIAEGSMTPDQGERLMAAGKSGE